MLHHRVKTQALAATATTVVAAVLAVCTSVPAHAVSTSTPVEAFGTGLLGNGTTSTSTSPVKITGLSGHDITDISSYTENGEPGDHTLALTSGGSIYSWGSNDHGQLGDGTERDSYTPSQPLPLPASISGRVVAVSAGHQFSMALTSTGQVLTWGASGQLGDGAAADRLEPALIPAPGGQRAIAISAGESHAEVVTASGQVWGWGSNSHGELGDGTFQDRLTPVRAKLPAGFVATEVAAAGVHYAVETKPESHTLALSSDGRVFGWGDNMFGQLGIGSKGADEPLPVQTLQPHGTTAKAIAAGGENGGEVTTSGEVLTWGLNTYGALCAGTIYPDAHPEPAALPAGVHATTLSMSYYSTLLTTTTGLVLGCGDNTTFAKGVLATDTVKQTSEPIALSLPSGSITAIDAGGATNYVVVQR